MPKRSPLDPHSYGKSTSWKVDMDYVEKLSPEDRAWLEKFCLGEYGGSTNGLHSPDQMRDVWRDKKRASKDVLNTAVSIEVTQPTSTTPSPEDIYGKREKAEKHRSR